MESHNTEDNPIKRWLLPVAIAICAAGAGVTGTLLWVQENRPSAPTSSAPASALIQSAPAPMTAPETHEPPSTLTGGMTPPQKALTLGNWYYDHEQWPRAISHYQQAIAGGIDNPNVRTDLGNCFRFNQQPQTALEQYVVAQKLDPRHEQSLFNQGGLYRFSLKNPQKAIAVWREYLRRFPGGQSAADAKRLISETHAQMTSGTNAAKSMR